MFNINHIQVLGFLPFPYSSCVHSSNHSYSYLNPKLAKLLCLSYYRLCFPINKIREESGLGKEEGGRWHNNVYRYNRKMIKIERKSKIKIN
jgi:hypothetical protein